MTGCRIPSRHRVSLRANSRADWISLQRKKPPEKIVATTIRLKGDTAMRISITALIAFCSQLLLSFGTSAQSLPPLANQAPDGISFTLLLTDGTVMAQDGFYPYMWWKLTPDINGSYLNGAWSQLASLPVAYSPIAASEAVLADGRVLLIGGEYSNFTLGEPFTLTNQGAIYDPR